MLPFYRALIGGRGKSDALYEIGAFLLDGVAVNVDGAGRRGIGGLRAEVSFWFVRRREVSICSYVRNFEVDGWTNSWHLKDVKS